MDIEISFGTAAAYSLLGFAIVFFGLILLMIVIKVMAAIMGTGKKKETRPAVAPAPAPAAAPVPAAPVAAPGSAGEVKLYNVPDKEAAMIMAIVANKMQRPLNELRFKSIKEVK